VVWQWAYSAFGDEEPTTGAKRFTGPATHPSTGRTHLEAVTFNLRYPGQVADGETGLSYNYFRSYDSRTGRYTQSDPIGMDGGLNTYAYANSAPTMYADPLGLLVEVCKRAVDIDWIPGGASRYLPGHSWFKTDTAEAGMGANCPVPGQGCSDRPLDRTYAKDHSGQSTKQNASCTPVPDVNEQCVNKAIALGQYLGRWTPVNQCQSFVQTVIERCSTNGMNRPYIGYPKP
jgi:RHS repeat-associated protein